MKKIAFLMIACLSAAWTGASGEDGPARRTWTQPIRFSVPEASVPVATPTPAATPAPAAKPAPTASTRSAAERTGAIHYAPAMKAVGATAPAATTAPAAAPVPAPRTVPETEVLYEPADDRWMRLELGLRSMGVHLTNAKKGEPFNGSFVGSIYKLKAKQNWLPIHPFAQLEFVLPCGLWLGGGATYSHLDVETLDDGGGDGDIESDLLLAYAVLEYPTECLRPYAEAGFGRAFNTFDADSSWSAGGRREFVLEDSPAWMVGGGIGLAVTERFTVDAHLRYVHFDVDGTYVFRGDSRPDTDFTFTPSYVAAGIGASYAL